MENEFPPNSHAKKEARPERVPAEKASDKREVARVTRSKAIQRKKPLHKKFFEAFKPEDNVGFVEYTLLDVLVPGIKDALADAVHGTIDNALGSSPSRSRRSRGGGGHTSYNRMAAARPASRRNDRDDDRRPARGGNTATPFEHREFCLPTRVEADEVIDNLFELLSKYEVATARDLYSMLGEPHDYTDEDWGWTDLRGARIHKVREGYLLDLPRPIPLD